MEEIKKMTTLQVNLYMQRNQEPRWREEIEQEVNKNA
jgi:hypothetical protein